jgi:hypothetical protein
MANQESAQYPNEIRGFASHLVLREVPGKLVQWCWHTHGLCVALTGVSLVDPTCDEIAWVAAAPLCLRLGAALALALRC